MEMHQVRYFLAVCRTLNFTKAAEECNVAQPSLTRAIQKLEEEFGGLLFHRERANTHLTELGRAMQPHLERTLEAAQSARQMAAGFKKGEIVHLRLGVSHAVPPLSAATLLQAVLQAIPGLEVTLDDGPDERLVETALAGDLDLILAGDDTALPERIRSWTLHKEALVAVLHPGHPLAGSKALTLSDLSGLEVIEVTSNFIASRFRQFCTDKAVSPKYRMHAGSPSQALSLVQAGLGITILPRSMPVTGTLQSKPVEGLEIERAITLGAVAGRKFSPASDAFIKLARTRDWSAALS